MYNKILILVALCVYCKGTDTDPIFRNDYKYYSEANGWFKLHNVPMTWENAQYQCSYEGAILVSPLNKQLQDSIAKFLHEQNPIPEVTYSGVRGLKGIYQSIEGLPLEEMPIQWSKNEPASPDGCVVFYSNGTMAIKSFFTHYPYICYKENKKLELVRNECGTIDNGYSRINGSTNCYKYHSEPIDWEEAYKICYAEGARLSINQDIRPSDFVTTKEYSFYIGYRNIGGVWWDITGNRMEPYTTGQSGDCGALTTNHTFSNKYCSENHPFLCEKTPEKIV